MIFSFLHNVSYGQYFHMSKYKVDLMVICWLLSLPTGRRFGTTCLSFNCVLSKKCSWLTIFLQMLTNFCGLLYMFLLTFWCLSYIIWEIIKFIFVMIQSVSSGNVLKLTNDNRYSLPHCCSNYIYFIWIYCYLFHAC